MLEDIIKYSYSVEDMRKYIPSVYLAAVCKEFLHVCKESTRNLLMMSIHEKYDYLTTYLISINIDVCSPYDNLVTAMRFKKLDIVKYIFRKYTIECMAESKSREKMDRFTRSNCLWQAVQYGYFDAVTFFMTTDCFYVEDVAYAISIAMGYQHTNIKEYLCDCLVIDKEWIKNYTKE